MPRMHVTRAAIAAIVALLSVPSALVRAATFDVAIDTSFLNGMQAVVAFDFIDGGTPPDNSVVLSPLTSNGTQSSTSTTGNVIGSGPWTFSDAGGSFFDELLVAFNPMGTSLSFSFTTTDKPPEEGALPDGFSMYVLDSSGLLPLIATDDPTGAGALFLYSFGQGSRGMSVFGVDQQGFTVNATAGPNPAPEPGIPSLLLAGAIALLMRKRLVR